VRVARDERPGDQQDRTRRHAHGVHRHWVYRWEPPNEHRRFREAQSASHQGEHGEQRDRLAQWRAGDQGDPDEREESSKKRRQAEAFLAVGHRE